MLTQRGTVLALTIDQIVTRWLYLCGKRKLADLDEYARGRGVAPLVCPPIYYLLHEHNGGKDPSAPDPADRWQNPGSTFVNRTADCVAAVAWGQGWDRYQPQRFNVPGYEGWINTDSARWEAANRGECFERIARPEPGAAIVYASDPQHHSHGIPVGHIGGITAYHLAEWNPADPACWEAIEVANIAAYKNPDDTPAQANRLTTGAHWQGKDAWFLRSIMKP